MLTKTGKAQLNELQYAEEVVLVYSSPDGQKLHVVQGPSLANTLRGHGNPIANAPPPWDMLIHSYGCKIGIWLNPLELIPLPKFSPEEVPMTIPHWRVYLVASVRTCSHVL